MLIGIIVFLGGMTIGLIIAIVTNRLHTLMNNPFSEICSHYDYCI